MSIGSVSFKYTLNKFPVKKNFDVRVNVKTELEYLRIGSSYAEDGIGLAYINSSQTNPEDNVLLIDKSNNISLNAKENITELKYEINDFSTSYSAFEIADVVKDIDGVETPLYYWHDMSHLSDIDNLEILDTRKNPVNPNLWLFVDEQPKLGSARKGIYSNLICLLDRKQNRYEAFYARYKSLNTNIITEELLDSKPYYDLGSYNSNSKSREYVASKSESNYSIKILFNSLAYSPTPSLSGQRFWVKRKATNKIALSKPVLPMSPDDWTVKISAGDFFHNGLRYWLPEYYSQSFLPFFPYSLVREKKATVINKNLIFTDAYPILSSNIKEGYVYIIIRDFKGDLKRAFTNNPSLKVDAYLTADGLPTGIFYEKDVIKSISTNSGFILLSKQIEEDDQVFINCAQKEEFYSYDSLSFNPSINSDLLDKKVVFYIVPNATERGLHHLIINSDNIIKGASDKNYAAGNKEYSLWEKESKLNNYFEIGEVHVKQGMSLSDLVITDIRIPGGGISDSSVTTALSLQSEASSYWDLGNWEGTSYPGMGAFVVYLPRYILKEMKGDFERNQVQEIVKRHAAAGSYIIIRYYDDSVQIIDITPQSKMAKITWSQVDATAYNIYLGSSPDNLSLYSSERGGLFSTTLKNLENNKTYYVQIAPVVGGIERLRSQLLGFMPFSYAETLPSIKYNEKRFGEGAYE